MIDGATIPLKVLISDLVTQVLYTAGYPIAQNGVVILIGPYQLLVEDACSGLNSIFALSAIGVFYVYAFRWHEKIRSINPSQSHHTHHHCRELYSGHVPRSHRLLWRRGQTGRVLHDLTGIALFVVAVTLRLSAMDF